MTPLLSMEMPEVHIDAGDGTTVTGFVALASLAVIVLASARIRALTSRFGLGGVYGAHRIFGVVAVVAVALHIVFALVEDMDNYIRLLPWSGNAAGMAADASTYGMCVLIALAMRSRRRDYDKWRRWHLALAVTVILGAILHVIFLNHLVRHDSFVWWLVVVSTLSIGGLLYRWVTHPLSRNSYTVLGVRAESPSVTTVTLVPKQGRHRPNKRGAHFRPGQFGWLRLTKRAGTDHPYSFSSSAHDAQKVQVTVRRGGRFTENLVHSGRGRAVWVDGPHGNFTPPDNASGLVLIAAGVGITPIMSILRSCADWKDERPIRLVQAAESPPELLFTDEVNRLASLLNLQVTRLVSRRDPNWSGLVGHIDAPLLHRILPGAPMRNLLHSYICGPPVMVSNTIAALILLGIPRNHIHDEQFLMPTPRGSIHAPKHATRQTAVSGSRPAHVAPQYGNSVSSTIPLPVVRDDRGRQEGPQTQGTGAGPQPQLHPRRAAQPAERGRPRHPVRAHGHRQGQRRVS